MNKLLSDLCKECGECCKYLVLPVVKPMNKAILEEWLDARGCSIVGYDWSAMYVKINYPCPHLIKSEEGYVCDQYSNRPEACRTFDGREYAYLDCKWKKADIAHVILEKSAGRCPHDNKIGVLLRRYKEGAYWVREFKCPNGHIFTEQQ